MTYDYQYFVKEIFKLTSIDLSSYKEAQMKRRIDALITKHNVKGYDNYIEILKKNKDELNYFIEYTTINVSEFYRNTDQWKILTDTILPDLYKKFGSNLKVWSAACSTGDEPYSLVMAMSGFQPLSKVRVTATDISNEIIDKANIGLYGSKSIVGVPDQYKKKYFKQNGNFYQVSDEIKRCVDFKKQDLLRDPYLNGCHLIVCRNVLIYFTEEAKSEIFRKFYNSLAPGGVLFIGSTEQIIDYKDIGFKRLDSFFYAR